MVMLASSLFSGVLVAFVAQAGIKIETLRPCIWQTFEVLWHVWFVCGVPKAPQTAHSLPIFLFKRLYGRFSTTKLKDMLGPWNAVYLLMQINHRQIGFGPNLRFKFRMQDVQRMPPYALCFEHRALFRLQILEHIMEMIRVGGVVYRTQRHSGHSLLELVSTF